MPYAMDLDYVLSGDNNDGWKGVIPDNYPKGIASAPVTWVNDESGKIFYMKFLAGFVGYTQDEKTLEICPNISWCIAYEKDKKSSPISGAPLAPMAPMAPYLSGLDDIKE